MGGAAVVLAVGLTVSLLIVVVVFGSGLLSPLGRGDDARSVQWKVLETLEAPGGGHTATRYVQMGGGAAGWCRQEVEINTRENPFSIESKPTTTDVENGRFDHVFGVRCGDDFEMEWMSDRELQITYRVDPDKTSVFQRSVSLDGEVSITYRFR